MLMRLLVSISIGLFVCQSCFAQTALKVRDSVGDCLKLRIDHNASVESIACLEPGTVVSLIDDVPYWRKVRIPDGKEGWAAKKYLEAVITPTPASPDSPIPPNAWLRVHFVDVGQGDAIWIQTYDDGIDGNGIYEGKNIIIDGGPNSSDASNSLLSYVESRIHHNADIDALIVTHAHDDHYKGAESILRHFEVKSYYDPGYPPSGTAYPAFLNFVKAETWNGHPTKVMIGKAQFDALDWGKEIKAEILYSYPGVSTGLGSATNTIINNSSIVLRLQYGSQSFLFMGDAEGKERADNPQTAKYVESVLLNSVPNKLKSTVLKIAHHGSETSSTEPFILAVDPTIVVVCSGRKSFNGRYIPDASSLKRYCCHNSGIRLYRTDQNDEQEHRTTENDQDGDHIVIETNSHEMNVSALSAGSSIEVNECLPRCDQ